MTQDCSQVALRLARQLKHCIMGSVFFVLSALHIAGPLITRRIDLYKMISWARYNCKLDQMWPAGLELDTKGISQKKNIGTLSVEILYLLDLFYFVSFQNNTNWIIQFMDQLDKLFHIRRVTTALWDWTNLTPSKQWVSGTAYPNWPRWF